MVQIPPSNPSFLWVGVPNILQAEVVEGGQEVVHLMMLGVLARRIKAILVDLVTLIPIAVWHKRSRVPVAVAQEELAYLLIQDLLEGMGVLD